MLNSNKGAFFFMAFLRLRWPLYNLIHIALSFNP
jgi:hypothetical protein